MRDFDKWLKTMKDSIATWNYYTDFDKVYKNVGSIKIELNILNSLIGSKNIKEEFRKIIELYPNTLKAIPILLAKREKEIKINDENGNYQFNFEKPNYSPDEYVIFMEKTGLFELLQNHIIHNLVDYVTGVEVGLDSNGRKNRTGHTMEDLVESYLKKAGFIKNKTYFKEMYLSEVEKRFCVDLSNLSNQNKVEKRFDFVALKNNKVYGIECNFYGSDGSKLNETARSYKTLAIESKTIDNFVFVWLTDGKGWNSAKNNLEETFDELSTVFNLYDLENGAFDKNL